MQKQKMATKRLGRGLEALLVDVPNELTLISSTNAKSQQDIEQQRIKLLQEAVQLKSLLEMFEQFVSQLEISQN